VAGHDIIVIGASAGGLEPLQQIVGDLPPDLPAAIFVVLHFPQGGRSVLPEILNRLRRMSATHPHDGQTIQPGRIYVAPTDHHLLLERGHMRLSRGPRENHSRPAVDPLFRTAALAYGARVVGVLLSGALDDGTAGLAAVHARGGVTIVQDPAEALYPSMPASALEQVPVDHVLPVREIARTLLQLARTPVSARADGLVPEEMEVEGRIANMDPTVMHNEERPGAPAGFACPDCGGALWDLQDGDLTRFRCRVGHALSPESLLAGQSERVEEALWTAMNALDEIASLSQRLSRRAQQRNQPGVARRFQERAENVRQRAEIIRRVLQSGDGAEDAPELAREEQNDAAVRKPGTD
jgi:two-component system chemotaxis response regulator CheB